MNPGLSDTQVYTVFSITWEVESPYTKNKGDPESSQTCPPPPMMMKSHMVGHFFAERSYIIIIFLVSHDSWETRSCQCPEIYREVRIMFLNWLSMDIHHSPSLHEPRAGQQDRYPQHLSKMVCYYVLDMARGSEGDEEEQAEPKKTQ